MNKTENFVELLSSTNPEAKEVLEKVLPVFYRKIHVSETQAPSFNRSVEIPFYKAYRHLDFFAKQIHPL